MDFDQNNLNVDEQKDEELKSPVVQRVEQFKEWFVQQDKRTQGLVVGGAFLVILFIFSGGDDPKPVRVPSAAVENKPVQSEVKSDVVVPSGVNEETMFIDPSRESMQAGFVERQEIRLDELRSEVRQEMDARKKELTDIQGSIQDQNLKLQQMIDTFNSQMSSFEQSNATYRDEVARIVEQAQKNLKSPDSKAPVGMNGGQPQGVRKPSRISQTPLASRGSGVAANPNQALLGFARDGVSSDGVILDEDGEIVVEIEDPKPFIPPIGFVKGTLLNGFDALAGGRTTPALARLSGKYKTAMNSTVSLDGCWTLVEFEGDISTERAMGKPTRMTCVYPDQGAVTYELTGYVVDAFDGIVGVPGVFYEGDAARLAAAMVADFAAGVANVVNENQSTSTVDSEGTAQTTVTGSQARAEIAGGVTAAMGNLSDYLFERANRIVPFIRVDSTRDLHFVILSGTELRDEGRPWTLLFDAVAADKAKDKAEQKIRKAQERRDRKN